jgi:hypothetical protein
MVDLALQAVAIVKSNSELKDLWEEGDANEWRKVIEDLERKLRLSSATSPQAINAPNEQ